MNKTRRGLITISVALAIMVSAPVSAQRGMGESAGVAQQAVKPPVTTVSGKILDIRTGPCEKTAGKSPRGTHLIVQSDGTTLNIHLGPAKAVDHVVAQLTPGQSVTFEVFRTETMPADAYIAKSLTVEEKVIYLRDDNLRPSWAYGRGKGQGGGQGGGKGRGALGPCW
jgi:hypothetical protein